MKRKSIALAIAAALASGSASAAGGFNWNLEWTFNHTAANGSKAMGSEIVAFDAANDRLWVAGTDANGANLGLGGIDILDMSGNLLQSIDTSSLGGINSVALGNGLAAIALTAPIKTDPGLVRFYDAGNYNVLQDVTVGANPDAVTFTPNGGKLLVANEGEPSSYLVGPSGDPLGSVSIIDTATFNVQTASFEAFNAQADTLKAAGVRLTGPNASVAQDLEPEYIAVSKDGTTAMVTLQEANSVAIVDIESASVTAIKALGLKDHSLPGNGLDVSDRDGAGNNPLNGNIQNWNVQGMYMPDGIAGFEKSGKQYYVIANEGDSRADWPGGNDELRLGSAVIDAALNDAMTLAHGADWQTNNDKLNRLTVSTSGDLDGDGDLDAIHVFGGRSFSILDAAGTMLFDSGNQLEQIIMAFYPQLWDDTRSDNKGPEPESAVVGQVNGRDLLFLGLERSNAVMVWDLTDLANITFLDMLFTAGDISPEGLSFFSNASGHYLAVANEVSGTTSLYKVSAVPVPGAVWLFGSVMLGFLGVSRRKN
ncbi:choice-of-anchor I family protein [Methylomonas sp. SURF-2]|uniref:Choice-of-anchor I family protein n=1 Tax=Methylomonas subterranea TaxID=2952225 RepID=A0ABT1TE04_9GAMM|nr:choice-of-anchor I family protein [Methylomonas sp. SURF-2]MCQ8103503.1 choice-of-anchor I family protein [Methylomonas sp. SURF-2]